MPLAVNFPAWITPEMFPGAPGFLGDIRWYGLMYLFAFVTAFLIFRIQAKEGALNTAEYTVSTDDMLSFFTWGILGLLIGARLFSVLIYDTSGIYWQKPWLIFWPFDENWNFTGLQGMSYHGGFVGGLIGMILWCWRRKQRLFRWLDVMAVSIPLGYTFGRLGNFINGELFGRVTTVPWGMIFPGAARFSVSQPWVQSIVEEAHLTVPPGALLVNLPRHPSQLYEALFEGVILWLILWLLRKHKPFDGFLSAIYIMGYGIARFIIEYFREPDADLGYRIMGGGDAPTYFNTSLLNLSTGQVLSLIMIAGGIALMIVMAILHKRQKAKEHVSSPMKHTGKKEK